jgi:hypothetical protein
MNPVCNARTYLICKVRFTRLNGTAVRLWYCTNDTVGVYSVYDHHQHYSVGSFVIGFYPTTNVPPALMMILAPISTCTDAIAVVLASGDASGDEEGGGGGEEVEKSGGGVGEERVGGKGGGNGEVGNEGGTGGGVGGE